MLDREHARRRAVEQVREQIEVVDRVGVRDADVRAPPDRAPMKMLAKVCSRPCCVED